MILKSLKVPVLQKELLKNHLSVTFHFILFVSHLVVMWEAKEVKSAGPSAAL